MIRVYATAKLRKKLPLTKQSFLLQTTQPLVRASTNGISNNPLSGWHSNLLAIQRRQCILFVHDVSRFCLFIPCLVKQDFEHLNWHFQDVLMNTLQKCGIQHDLMNRATDYLDVLCFDQPYNRSVQGTINQADFEVEHMLSLEQIHVADVSPYQLSAWLSDRPCMMNKQKDCI